MKVPIEVVLKECILLNNRVLHHLDDLGIAIRHKDNKENHLFKISEQIQSPGPIFQRIGQNVALLDLFMDFMFYFFNRMDQLILLLENKENKDFSIFLQDMYLIAEEVLSVLENKKTEHENYYLEMKQWEDLLNVFKNQVFSLIQEKNLTTKKVLDCLKDPIEDIRNGRRSFHRNWELLENLVARLQ